MRRLVVSILFLIFVGTAFSQTNDARELVVHKDPTFSLSYPSDWSRIEPVKPPYSLRIFRNDGVGLMTLNVISTFDETQKSKSAKTLVKEMPGRLAELDAGYKRELPSTKIVSSGERRLGDLEAFYVKARVTVKLGEADREMFTYQIQTIQRGQMYTITFSYDVAYEATASPVLERIASTFVAQ